MGRSGRGRLALAGIAAVLIPACGVGGGSGTLTPTVAPGIPTNLIARSGNQRIKLSWNASPAARSYSLRRSTASHGLFTPVPGAQDIVATDYVDGALSNGTTYYYQVVAANAYGVSAPSLEASAPAGLLARKIAAGIDHTLAVLDDGTLWSWGANIAGALGSGTGTAGAEGMSTVAVQVAGLPGEVQAIAAGTFTSMALMADGTVWAWGDNGSGLFGTATPTSSSTPVQVPGLSGVTAISVGSGFCLALLADGTVLAWGENFYGQLGTGSGPARTTPLRVPGLSGVKGISAGSVHALAVLEDGTVLGWGTNQNSALSTLPALATPGRIINLSNVRTVYAGLNYSFAVTEDGTAWGWGWNASYQLGSSPAADGVVSPTPVPNFNSVVSLSLGAQSTAALRTDGTVWMWGSDAYGQFGNGGTSTPTTPIPQKVSAVSNVQAIASGNYHVMAVRADGLIWGWGHTGLGQVGGGTGGIQHKPVQVVGLTDVVAIRGGLFQSFAIRSDSGCWGWGSNMATALADGDYVDVPFRTPVRNSSYLPLVGVGRLSIGSTSGHTLAVMTSGAAWAWGANADGQLGINATQQNPFVVPTALLSNVSRAATGATHSLAVLGDQTVRSVGSNGSGELGNNSTAGVVLPVTVTGLSGVTEVAAGNKMSLALKSDGTLWAWGANNTGQLGDNTLTERHTAVQVSVGGTYTAIAAGYEHCLALRNDGVVVAWGNNSSLQLGQPAATPLSKVPFPVPSLSGVIAVGAGGSHSLALKSDGTVWAWGANGSGQLGGALVDRTDVPVQIPGLSGMTAISAGLGHNLALAADGTIRAWGANSWGQIGIGSTDTITSPLEILH